MEKYKTVRLGDVSEIVMGTSPEGNTISDNPSNGIEFHQGKTCFGRVFLDESNLYTSVPSRFAEAGNVIMSVRAPVGDSNITQRRIAIGRGLCTFNLKDDFEKFYLFYFLNSKIEYLQSKSTGSTFKAVNKDAISDLQIPLPPLEEQKHIAAVLDKCTALIAKHKLMLEKYDLLIKSRFVEMFGEPYSNPMGWERKTFKEAAVRLSDGPFGSNLKSEHYSSSGIRVIRLGNIGVNEFLDADKAFIPLSHYETLKKYTCKSGEIVIGTMGVPNLRACIIPEEIEVSINKADCVHYIPKPELLDTRFVCQYINCHETLLLASSMIHGQTRTRVSSGQIAEMPISVPPLALQQKFATFVQAVDAQKAKAQKSLEKAEILYKALMQNYFG